MQRRRLAVLLFAASIALILPVVTFAATNATGAGLVPCGVGENPTTATQCEACNLVQLLQNIITFLIALSIPLAVAMFAYAGFLYFSSATSSENVGKAKSIFGRVGIGFVLILGSWIVINTLLYTILDHNRYPNSSWFRVDCTTLARPINTNIGQVILDNLGNFADLTIGNTPQSATPQYSCDKGTVSADNKTCINDTGQIIGAPKITYDNPTVSLRGGSCSTFTQNNLLSCISAYESSCNPVVPSKTDVGTDGRSVSWGLTQWNISANPINCYATGGKVVNCPDAFTGAYTSKQHNIQVKNDSASVALYNQCVSLASNPACNLEMAQQTLKSNGGSLAPWGQAARSNCQ